MRRGDRAPRWWLGRGSDRSGAPEPRRAAWTVAILALGLAGLATACAGALPPPDATPRQRFEWSLTRYEQGKYAAAIRGFRDHLFRDPLHATSDSARYLLARSYLESGQELLAANEFRQLATTRANSPLADDAQLGSCQSYWALSPDLARDQQFTEKAIDECTRLLEYFPRSDLLPEAREILGKAREKLAAKQLRIGRFYYERKLYESAIIYFEGLLRDYPDAESVPETLYLLQDAYDRVGFRSEAEAARNHLLQTFPDSPQARRLESGSGE